MRTQAIFLICFICVCISYTRTVKDLPDRDSWEHFNSDSWESSDFDSFDSFDSKTSGKSAHITNSATDLKSRRNIGSDFWQSSDSEISDSADSNNLKKYRYHGYDSDDKSDTDDSESWDWNSKGESNKAHKILVTSDLYDSGSWDDSDSDSNEDDISGRKQVTDGSRHAINGGKGNDNRKRWSDERLSRNSEFSDSESDEPPISMKHTITNKKNKFRDSDSFNLDSDVSDRGNNKADRWAKHNFMKQSRGNTENDRFYWNSESSDDRGDDLDKWGKHTSLKQWSESDDEGDSFDWDSDSDVRTKPNKIRWSNNVNTVEDNNRFDFGSDSSNEKSDEGIGVDMDSNNNNDNSNNQLNPVTNQESNEENREIEDNSLNNQLNPVTNQESNEENREIEDNSLNNQLNPVTNQEPNEGNKEIDNHNSNRGVINIVLPHLATPKRNGDNDIFFRNKKMNLFERGSEEKENEKEDKRQIIQKRLNFLHSTNNKSLVRVSKLGKSMFPNLVRNDGEENEIEDD